MDKRQIIKTFNETLLTYNIYGKETNDLKWFPISKDHNSKYEVCIIKFKKIVHRIFIDIMEMKSFMSLRVN